VSVSATEVWRCSTTLLLSVVCHDIAESCYECGNAARSVSAECPAGRCLGSEGMVAQVSMRDEKACGVGSC
jgi:hypothetical protein